LESLSGIFFSSFIIAISGALMPGPVLTVTISESARSGFWAGPLIILGHAILEIVLLCLIVLGLAQYISRPEVIGVVGIAGGLILFWFSFLMLKDIRTLTMACQPNEGYSGGPVRAGIFMSLSNPYWSIWWATIGLGYVVMSMKFGLLGLFLFFSGHILADLLWYSSIALVVSRGRQFISDRVYRGVVGVCALFLFCFGLYFGISGLQRFI
jgi:threonine/homoserine/homoserine lactone efflux protein